MNRHLALTLSLLAAVALPAVASAKQQKPTAACGSSKVVAIEGVLAGGSVLEQVAGLDTDIVRDDRYTGSLVVRVTKPVAKGKKKQSKPKLGKQRIYAVSGVRVQGISLLDDDTAPPSGTQVRLVGRRTTTCAAPGSGRVASAARVSKTKVMVIEDVRFKQAKGSAGSTANQDSADEDTDEDAEDDAPLPGEDVSEEGSDNSSSSDEDDDATYSAHKKR